MVAVPTDYNGTKMRVCAFKVVALGEDERNEVLYGHNKEEIEEEHEELDYLRNELMTVLSEIEDVEIEIHNFDLIDGDIEELMNLRDNRNSMYRRKDYLENHIASIKK